VTRKRMLLGLLIVVGIAATAWDAFPLDDASDRLDLIPRSGMYLTSRDVVLSAREQADFGRARVIRRVYQVRGQRAVLTVLDGSQNRHAVHDPEYCYRGAGWEVTGREAVPLVGGAADLLRLHRGDENTEVLCWYSDGTERHASPTRYWWQATLRRVSLGRSGAEPVLVLVQPYGGEPIDWRAFLDDFPSLLDL
jgi:hypothetical protein